jgi:ubiquitin thioesterase OTU1
MRIGLRGAFGQSQITIDDSATVDELHKKITEAASLDTFDLKGGFPPRLIDLSAFDPTTKLSETGLKLNGERLQVEVKSAGGQPSGGVKQAPPTPAASTTKKETSPTKSSQPNFTQPSQTTRSTTQSSSQVPSKPLTLSKPAAKEVEPPEVLIRNGTSYLIHRVMPDDNSCLFRAIGKCVLGGTLDAVTELRSIVAQAIQAQPDKYDEVVLDQKPDEYCKWIQTPDAWGGAIEIGIIAQQFDIEVFAINISDGSVQKFNESGQGLRAYLVYSGIHWDCIVENFVGKDGPGDIDVAQFEVFDDEVYLKAKEIGEKLGKAGYYTDTKKFGIVCNTCKWEGTGEQSAAAHFAETKHTDFGQLS